MVKALRDMPECSRVPVLVTSAYGSGKLDDAMKAGANQVMRKPVDYELFVKAIRGPLD